MSTRKLFYDRYSVWILLATLFLSPFVLHGAYLSVVNKRSNTLDWLPKGFAETDNYDWFRQHFGRDQIIVASWEGCVLGNPALDDLARYTLDETGNRETLRFFDSVASGNDLVNQLENISIKGRHANRREIIDRLRGTMVGLEGEQTCAIFVLSEEGENNVRFAIEAVYEILSTTTHTARDEIHLGGLPVENRAIDAEGEWTLLSISILSGIVALMVAWTCLQSWRLITLVFLTAIASSAMSLAIVWYAGGTLDAFQLTMPSLVYVITLSGAVHLVNYYKDEICENDLAPAVDGAIVRGWLPCSLAVGTTAIGLASLVASDLDPVKRFGVYAASGVVCSLIFLFGLLPAALQRWPPNLRQEPPRPTDFLQKLCEFVLRFNLGVFIVSVIILVIAALGLPRVNSSLKVINLFSEESRIVQDYRWLEQHLGGFVPLEIVIQIDPDKSHLNFLRQIELVEKIQQSVVQLELVTGAMSATSFAPPIPTISNRKVVQRSLASKKLENYRSEFVKSHYLSEIDTTDGGLQLWRISARALALHDLDYDRFAADVQKQVEMELSEPPLADIDGVSVVYTGLVPLLAKTQRQLLVGLVESLALAFVLIGFVMMLVLRSPITGLLSMIPNIFPVVFIYGSMGWLEKNIDLGSMITASVAMGVAVDDTVHFLTWFRRGLDVGLTQHNAIRYAYRSCAKAMCQTSFIAGLGLLMFMFSSFTSTARFGCLMFMLLMAALVGDLVVLPAMLAGPAGKIFRSRPRSNREADVCLNRDDEIN